MAQFGKKELSFGFIVLSPEHNIGRIQGTIRSIRNHYGNVPVVCITGEDITPAELKEIKAVCPAHKGGATITSLLNLGMKKGHNEWNFFVMEGTWVRRGLQHKFAYWIEDERDVLFPIVVDYDRDGRPVKIYKDFEECSLNGLCMNQKFFKAIGNFSENPLDVSKRFWQFEANDRGGKFKAILGAKLL